VSIVVSLSELRLPEPPADDGVVAIRPQGDRDAGIDFLTDMVADESFPLVGGRRTLPGVSEA